MDKLPYTFYFKDLDSRFVAVSRTCAENHGRKDPAQMIGLTDRDLFSSEHAEGAADEREIIRTGKPIIDYEEEETWRDREDTWASTTKMPWRDAQGNVVGTFGIPRTWPRRNALPSWPRCALGRVPPWISSEALWREKQTVLGGELMEISIMFSDIKGLTALSERLDPNRLAEMLGLCLDRSLHLRREPRVRSTNISAMPSWLSGTRPSRCPITPRWRALPR